jgi:hypothetical protein
MMPGCERQSQRSRPTHHIDGRSASHGEGSTGWMDGNQVMRRKGKEWNYLKCMHGLSSLGINWPQPSRTLEEEWTNLINLKKQSLGRKIASHEEDKRQIAEMFEHIRSNLWCVFVWLLFSCSIASPICLVGYHSQSTQDRACNSGGPRGV